MIEINGQPIAAKPAPGGLTVTIMDLDDADATRRVVQDGRLIRSRIAVKRQIVLSYGYLPAAKLALLYQQMQDEQFEVTYPDPMTGGPETRDFYVSDRPASAAIIRNGAIWWTGVEFTLTEM